MKILTLSLWPINNNSIGGTERFVIDFSKSIKTQGIQTAVLTVSNGSSKTEGINCTSLPLQKSLRELNEFSLRRIFFNPVTERKILDFCGEIQKSMPKGHWDLLHTTSLLFCAIHPEKRKIFTLHTLPREFEQIFGKDSFRIVSSLIQKYTDRETLFVAPTKYYIPLFERSFKRKIINIPHAVDKERVTIETSREKILNEFKIPNKKLLILNTARLEIVQKRQDLLVKELGEIKEELPDFQLILTGVDDQYKNNKEILQKIADDCSIPLSFITLSIHKVSKLYKIADIVILPSKYESFGYSAIESLSLGIKTVLSDIPSFIEIAKGNRQAHIWNEKKGVSLGKAIYEAIEKKNSQVPRCWQNRYSMEEWAENYGKIIKNRSLI